MVSFKKITTLLFPIFTKNLTDHDVDFLVNYLNKQEQIIFYTMRYFDQRHSLDVAYQVKEVSKHRPKIYQHKIIKAALLHDVGKIYFKWSAFYRIIAFLLFLLVKPLADFVAERPKSAQSKRLAGALYNKKYHGKLAKDILKPIGVEADVIELIAKHHYDDIDDDSLEGAVLREADKRN